MIKKHQINLFQVTLAFRALDKDGRGTVETSEFKHLMTHVGQFCSFYWLIFYCHVEQCPSSSLSSHWQWLTTHFCHLLILSPAPNYISDNCNIRQYIEVKGDESRKLFRFMKIQIIASTRMKHEKHFAGDVLTEEEVMMLINAADKDGDGSLDFQEFVKIMMWTFQKLCFKKNRMTNQLREL